MKTNDLVTFTATAVGAAALTVALFLGARLEAGTGANPLAPTIAKPELIASGIRMTLAPAGGRQFQAGDQPGFELTAVNTLNAPSCASVNLTVSAAAPSSPLSRTLAIPQLLWSQTQSLSLRPNESKTFTFIARTNLPPHRIISVFLSEAASIHPSPLPAPTGTRLEGLRSASPGVLMLTISTVPPAMTSALEPKW
jgi:hypothetical protein